MPSPPSAGRHRTASPLDSIELAFDTVAMAVDRHHTFPRGKSRPPRQLTSEASTSLPELVDILTDALVEARLAMDALADSLRARQRNSSSSSPQANQQSSLIKISAPRFLAFSRAGDFLARPSSAGSAAGAPSRAGRLTTGHTRPPRDQLSLRHRDHRAGAAAPRRAPASNR